MERMTLGIYSQFTIHNSQLRVFCEKLFSSSRLGIVQTSLPSALAPQRRVIPLRGLFLLLARDSLQAASPHCFVRRFTIHNLKRLFSLVFEGLWLSVRIVQNGKSALGNLFTKGYNFLRDLALKILALFSFRGVVAIRKDSAKWKE